MGTYYYILIEMKVSCVLLLLVATVAFVAGQEEEEQDWSMNCKFSGSLCNSATGCSYGCWKNVCWSQCNGICTIKDIIDQLAKDDEISDGHDIIDKLTPDSSTCAKCAEWCYLNDGDRNYQPCSRNADCEAHKTSPCL